MAEAPSRRISTRSIIDTGRVLMSKKLCPTSFDTGATPARRPLMSVKVEDRPKPRRLNATCPASSSAGWPRRSRCWRSAPSARPPAARRRWTQQRLIQILDRRPALIDGAALDEGADHHDFLNDAWGLAFGGRRCRPMGNRPSHREQRSHQPGTRPGQTCATGTAVLGNSSLQRVECCRNNRHFTHRSLEIRAHCTSDIRMPSISSGQTRTADGCSLSDNTFDTF